MRKLIPLLACLLWGCVGGARDQFDVREKVATFSDDLVEVQIYQRELGYGYWVPVQDVTRTVLQTFIVEIEARNRKTGQLTVRRSTNLVNPRPDQPAVFPGFLGATTKFGYWSAPEGVFAVDFSNGRVRRLQCDQTFLSFGKWESAGENSIRRTNEHGVFEFTPEGARKL